MKKIFNILSIIIILLSACDENNLNRETHLLGSGYYEGEYWPTIEWRTCSPEQVGMNSDKILKVLDYAANSNINTNGILIIKDGYIILEAYFRGFSVNDMHVSYSLTKGFTSTLIGIAVDKRLINSVDDKIYQFFDKWQEPETPLIKKDVSIKHLLTMTAGIDWKEIDFYYDISSSDIFRMYEKSDDFIEYVLNKPIINQPGSEWHYSSGESMLLSGIIEQISGKSAFEFATEHLLEPIGILEMHWESDPAGQTFGGWGMFATVREYAKFGYLFLKKGEWDRKQIVSQEWIEEALQPGLNKFNSYGYHWHLAQGVPEYIDSGVPEQTFWASGMNEQFIIVIPEYELIIVRMGNDVTSDELEWNMIDFIKLVLDSMK